MESFAFKAANNAGQVIEGSRQAESRAALIADLRSGGYIPIRIAPASAAIARPGAQLLQWRSSTLTLEAIAQLLQKLAVLMSAGIPADRAIGMAAKVAQTPAMRTALEGAREKLRGGAGFSATLRAHFPKLPQAALSLIETGEATGELARALDAVARSIAAQLKLKRSLVSALIYPAILFLTTIASVLFLMAFVVPQFKSVFADAGAGLPLATAILIGTGEAIQTYGLFALLALVIGCALLYRWRQTPDGRAAIDGFLLRAPVSGAYVQKIEIARLARTLGSLVGAKVSLVRALALTGDGIGNTVMHVRFKQAAARAKEGERLAPALLSTGAWPSDAVEMIAIGEESGRLDLMLTNLADLYEGELERATERLLAVLTPALTLTMGALVAAIVGAVISAIVGAYDLPI